MKFKARLVNPILLKQICDSMSKVDKNFYMSIKPKELHFYQKSDITDGLQLSGKVSTHSIFNEVVLNSKSNNEIILNVSIQALSKIIQKEYSGSEYLINVRLKNKVIVPPATTATGSSQASTTSTVVSAANGNGNGTCSSGIQQPELLFTICGNSGQFMVIEEELFVEIVQKSLFDEVKSVPNLPDPDAAFFVPTGAGGGGNRFLGIVEKFQRFTTKSVTLTVFGGCSLSIQVDNSSYSVAATFKEVELIALDTGGNDVNDTSSVGGGNSGAGNGGTQQQQQQQQAVSVRVDVGKLYRVVSCASKVFRKIVCCIVSGSTIVFSGKADDLQITYYVPILC